MGPLAGDGVAALDGAGRRWAGPSGPVPHVTPLTLCLRPPAWRPTGQPRATLHGLMLRCGTSPKTGIREGIDAIESSQLIMLRPRRSGGLPGPQGAGLQESAFRQPT